MREIAFINEQDRDQKIAIIKADGGEILEICHHDTDLTENKIFYIEKKDNELARVKKIRADHVIASLLTQEKIADLLYLICNAVAGNKISPDDVANLQAFISDYENVKNRYIGQVNPVI